MSSNPQRGFTLVEMIIAMVIVSVGLAGVLAVLSRTGAQSADPMVTKQVTALAEGMMEEIMLKPVKGPGTPVPAGAGCMRTGFDEIKDYNGYDQPVCDITGTPGVAGYRIKVNVANASGNALAETVPDTEALRIEVTVNHGTTSYALVGWRYSY
ncbi:MAG TPA: prepilin-type N-terminal cleavage/methylation domain-containing protein [Pseudoduganella sp.]